MCRRSHPRRVAARNRRRHDARQLNRTHRRQPQCDDFGGAEAANLDLFAARTARQRRRLDVFESAGKQLLRNLDERALRHVDLTRRRRQRRRVRHRDPLDEHPVEGITGVDEVQSNQVRAGLEYPGRHVERLLVRHHAVEAALAHLRGGSSRSGPQDARADALRFQNEARALHGWAVQKGLTFACLKPAQDFGKEHIMWVGEDGRAGIRGVVADRAGPVLRDSLVGGFLSGVGQFFSVQQQKTDFPASPFTAPPALAPGQMLTAGAASGVSKALDKYADFYIKRLEQLQPVLQVAAGRQVDIVFTEGTQFGDTSVRQTIGKIRNQSRQKTIQSLEESQDNSDWLPSANKAD